MDHQQPKTAPPISDGDLLGIVESIKSLLQPSDPCILKRQNDKLKKLVTKQQEKIEQYKFRISQLEAKDNQVAIEKLDKATTSYIFKRLYILGLNLQIVVDEKKDMDLQLEQLKQDIIKLSNTVEQMQIELVKLQQTNELQMSNVKLLVIGELAFTFEHYVNLHKGVSGKQTPFKTLVDHSVRPKNPIPLPQQLTTILTDDVDEYVLSYEMEQLKNLRIPLVGHATNHNFSGDSVTELEFRDMLKSYRAANDDAVEFMINYIKRYNNGKFELRSSE